MEIQVSSKTNGVRVGNMNCNSFAKRIHFLTKALPMKIQKTCVFLTALLLSSALFLPTSRAEILVEMTGTVVTGDLDGQSLAGQEFILAASFSDLHSFEPALWEGQWNDEYVGMFKADLAFMFFPEVGDFIFDNGSLDLALYYGSLEEDSESPLAFAPYFVADAAPYQSQSDLQWLGFGDENVADGDPAFDGFDPELLTDFAYSEFDAQYARFSTSNFFGQTLNISEISTSGTYSAVSAVPEPSSLCFSGLLAGIILLRRRRGVEAAQR